MPWVDRVSAVLMVWYPGQEFGAALADVLLGRRSPGGRLPITIAMRDEDYAGHGVTLDDELNLDYELIKPGGFGHLERTGKAARFPFGFGLTYTWFRHENPTLNVDIETKMATVTVSVQNCGDRPGREVVQVYGRAPGEDHSRLIGFGAVELAPGAQGDITIDLPARAFSRWDESTNKWSVPSGEHVIRIGRSAEDVLAAQTVTFFR
jgi:beta-glucosidase